MAVCGVKGHRGSLWGERSQCQVAVLKLVWSGTVVNVGILNPDPGELQDLLVFILILCLIDNG